MTDHQVEEIRDALALVAELVIDAYMAESHQESTADAIPATSDTNVLESSR